MGSQNKEQDELTVLVTGFGPFRDKYPVNPSWEIAKSLPSHLPALRAKDPNSRTAVDTPPVRILVHPEAVRVNYKTVRELVPSLWETYQGHNADIVVHIGMAGPQPVYHIERRGHRTGYNSRDVDGELLEDEEEGGHGENWIWNGLPDEITTDLDLDDVLARWKGYSAKDLDLRITEDAGRYLCDFIYYSSLSTLYKQGRERKVVFWHVPAEGSEEWIKQGHELGVNLIRSLVESEVTRRRDQAEAAPAPAEGASN